MSRSYLRPSAGGIARFVGAKPDPENALILAADHPAVVEGRTLFPTRVAKAREAKRFLISGHNNSKIGKTVLKGPWSGMPIFTLTLEERATCPRSCLQWRSCYGSSMQWPSRWDHRDPEFEEFLRAEIITKAREYPEGLVVRLHVLGDFYSVGYVKLWADMLDRFPHLRVYGYTARREDDPDPEAAKIGKALRWLAENAYDQFAIRFSRGEPGPMHTVVVDEDPADPAILMCPAQTEKTAACSTCGLCWSESARDKTIGFLRHGMKSTAGKPRGRRVEKDELGLFPAARQLFDAMHELADAEGMVVETWATICARARIQGGTKGKALAALRGGGFLQMVKSGRGRQRSIYRIFAEPQEEFPPAPLRIPPAPAAKTLRPAPRRRTEAAAPAEPATPKKAYSPKAVVHKGRVMNPWVIGTADQFDIGTPEERIASLDEAEKARIAAQYGAVFKQRESQ